jgi:predicted restriction endonuclease
MNLEHPLLDLLQPFDQHTAGDRFLRRRCQRPDGTSVRRAVAATTLCNGWVRRILRDPHTGNVLEGGCGFPGCDRTPKWCDAHHLRPWEDHGPTDLDNGLLSCRRHHNLIHHTGWRLHRDPGTGTITARSPDGRTFTRRPGQTR